MTVLGKALRHSAVAAALGVCAPQAAAMGALSLETRYVFDDGPKTIGYSISTPSRDASGATLSLLLKGDLDAVSETVTVTIDGKTIAVLLDGRPDENSSLSADLGNQCASSIPVSLTIDEETLVPLLADGALRIELTISSPVNDFCGPPVDEKYYSFSASGSLTLGAGGNLGGEDVGEETTAAVSSMTQARTSVTISSLPSLTGRMTGGGGSPTLTGAGAGANGGFAFSGDLAGMRDMAAASFDGREATVDAHDRSQVFDVWFAGSYTYYDADIGGISQDGAVGVLQLGVDTRLSDRLLVGVAAFGDMMEGQTSAGADTSSLGFMVGPYLVFDLGDHLYLEALTALGRASNKIETPGAADAEYTSDRILLTGRLAGDWALGALSVRPSTRVTYYAERHEDFVAGDGSPVEDSGSVLGQFRFGPEVAYDILWEGGAARPYVGLEGVWIFMQTEQLVNGATVASEEFTGSASLGVDILLGRTSIRAGGRYDGLGDDDLKSVSGEFTLRMPLQ